MTSPSDVIKDVGILGIQMYFPKNVVNQSDLEQFNNVSPEKYTVGLGQKQMAFCSDNEDVVSISLTVTQSLIESYDVDTSSIGFLAVGSETLIDKSKSVKTELMRLFGDNHDIEGVDVKNACFGGTQALFHAIDWIYANYETEKRLAIAVLADIAIYEDGPARCTGGAGGIAILVGPNAPIAFEKGLRGSHMTSSWDFYKPITKNITEYPMVDPPDSLRAYIHALDGCYKAYRNKTKRITGEDVHLRSYSAAMFHCPYTKMVQKALSRLAYRDYEAGLGHDQTGYQKICSKGDFSPDNREAAKQLQKAAEQLWTVKTSINLELNRRIGNMYTPSLFAQLVAHLALRCPDDDNLNRILFFAYGSGSASSMFSAKVNKSHPRLAYMITVAQSIVERIDQREVFSPEKYTEILLGRERLLKSDVPAAPASSHENLFPGTYYLQSIDDKYRRRYGRYTTGISNSSSPSTNNTVMNCNGHVLTNGHHS